jgi:hypothetical protein
MDKYVGTKIIKARPMTRGDYNNFRGWTIPADENPNDEGYLVEYEDNYISWSPKKTFDMAYRKSGSLDFGAALKMLKLGFRVARKGWNGKGMFIYLVRQTLVDKEFLRNEASIMPICDNTGTAHFNSHIDMKTADGSVCVGWLASQTDMLAEDWEVIE